MPLGALHDSMLCALHAVGTCPGAGVYRGACQKLSGGLCNSIDSIGVGSEV